MANRLLSIKIKTEYAISAVSAARDQANIKGAVWYHAIGLFNAFYALNKELKIHTQNSDDVHLTAAVKAWRNANKSSIEAFFGTARNTATHQGMISTEAYLEWHEDFLNDTEFPVRKANVTVDNSKINKMPAEEFLDLCQSALIFLRDGIAAIDEDYKSRGGGVHELPTEAPFTDFF